MITFFFIKKSVKHSINRMSVKINSISSLYTIGNVLAAFIEPMENQHVSIQVSGGPCLPRR